MSLPKLSSEWHPPALQAATMAAISFLLFHICDMNFCDPDMWHEMSLFRQSLIEGWVPAEDRFAYTPTVSPSIHHEWGAGAVFYGIFTTFGPPGIMAFKYLLVATVVGGCYCCARWRGAKTSVFLVVAPAMALFSTYGFTTIRAQVFTLVLLSIMLSLLEIDQRGRRWWIVLWLPLHLVWLNVHAGFIVGAGLMALHAAEQLIRRRPFWHFVPVGTALAALVLVNPYGWQYAPYLLHGLTMARPLITEWHPLWQHDTQVLVLFLGSWIPVGYAIYQLGVRRMLGLVLLAAAAFAALKHTRHLSLYCVVWTCYVPAYLQQTTIGDQIEQMFCRYGRQVTQASVCCTLLCLIRVIPMSPWQLVIPNTNAQAQQGLICYPVGAVDYLAKSNFRGHLMLPFEAGGYAMWNLKSEVKVSLDGRYEVAYRPGVLEEHLKLYGAKRGWQSVLTMYSTDAILVPCLSKLSSRMPTMKGWLRQYSDGVYEVYTRPGFALELPPTPVERVNFVARLFPNGLDRTEGWSSTATN